MKRYEPYGHISVDQEPDGEYVRFEDAAALIQRLIDAGTFGELPLDLLTEARAAIAEPVRCETAGCNSCAAQGWRVCERHKFYEVREPSQQLIAPRPPYCDCKCTMHPVVDFNELDDDE